MKAVVAFWDGSMEHPLSRLLKPGFRHCFCALHTADCWILVDGREGVPCFEAICGPDYDIAGFWRREGLTVVETERRLKPIRTPFVLANCVGLVKSVLCIRSAAITPWQLYRFLTKEAAHETTGIQPEPAAAAAGDATAADAGRPGDSRGEGASETGGKAS